MILVLCIDNNNGILFNNRRQSQDRKVRENLLLDAQDSFVWMNKYSGQQFGSSSQIKVSDDYINEASENEYCFAEELITEEIISKAIKIILYKWNRSYPSDVNFDLDRNRWKNIECIELKGYSHDKITKEVYIYEK